MSDPHGLWGGWPGLWIISNCGVPRPFGSAQGRLRASTFAVHSTSVTCCFRPDIPTSLCSPDEGGWTLAIPTGVLT